MIFINTSLKFQKMIKDYYDILSLRRDSSLLEINNQYKRLVLRWHPRFAKEDQKTSYHHFAEISEAYEVLSDPLKRAFFDKHGYLKLKEGLFSEGQLQGGYRFGDNPDEIFENFFQQNNALAQSIDSEMIERGSLFGAAYGGLNYKSKSINEDLVVQVSCNLHELYLGVAKMVNY